MSILPTNETRTYVCIYKCTYIGSHAIKKEFLKSFNIYTFNFYFLFVQKILFFLPKHAATRRRTVYGTSVYCFVIIKLWVQSDRVSNVNQAACAKGNNAQERKLLTSIFVRYMYVCKYVQKVLYIQYRSTVLLKINLKLSIKGKFINSYFILLCDFRSDMQSILSSCQILLEM